LWAGVGDAFGEPVEFMSGREILARFGPEGVAGYGGVGRITDDTQMTLFTAKGLIRAHNRFSDRGISNAPGVVHRAYQRWLFTQEGDAGPVPWDQSSRPAPAAGSSNSPSCITGALPGRPAWHRCTRWKPGPSSTVGTTVRAAGRHADRSGRVAVGRCFRPRPRHRGPHPWAPFGIPRGGCLCRHGGANSWPENRCTVASSRRATK